MRQFFLTIFLRSVAALCVFLTNLFRAIVRSQSSERDEKVMIATARYYSDNWILTHIVPMANARSIDKVILVTNRQVPIVANVESVMPSALSRKILGETSARLLTFARLVIVKRPFYVAGFHLLLNGLIALTMAGAIGARAVYICGGGPREVEGGGYATENALFGKLQRPDSKIEKSLLRAVRRMHFIIVMGSSAAEYFEDMGVDGKIGVLPGGIDESIFQPNNEISDIDIVTVGRISQVKRLDRFVEMMTILSIRDSGISAAIVGDGPDRVETQAQAQKMGVAENIQFVGWTDDVAKWLKRCKVFVMTSDSEGLSQALIQAQMCGLPSVVSNVGDLGDIVKDGTNGYLIQVLTPEEFARAVGTLLRDQNLHNEMKESAVRMSGGYSITSASAKWDALLDSYSV